MLKNRQILLIKPEVSYATDPVPVADTNAVLAELADIEIISKSLQRKNVKPYFGLLAAVNVGQGLKITFNTELKGSGVLGTPPEFGVLFRACDFTETITAATKVDYDPNSNTSTAESVTIYFYLDGLLHKLLGCRGTVSLDLQSGQYGTLKWVMTGIYAKPADQALVTGTYIQTIPPRFLSAAFTIDTYAAIIDKLTIDIGNKVVERTSANAATGILEYFIQDRAIVGTIDPEAVLVGTKDFYTMWDQSSRVAFSATVGQTAGNKCLITGSKVSLADLKYGDRNGILTLEQKLNFTTNAGNDEIKFSFQ